MEKWIMIKMNMNYVLTSDILLSRLWGLIHDSQVFIKAIPWLSTEDGFTAGAANLGKPSHSYRHGK